MPAEAGTQVGRLNSRQRTSRRRSLGANILARLDGVAASTGSACHAGRIELSPVLEAIGIAPEVGMGAIRFSLGRTTTDEEIDATIERLMVAMAEIGSPRPCGRDGLTERAGGREQA